MSSYDGADHGFVGHADARVGLDIQPGSASNFVVLKPGSSVQVVLYGSDQIHVPTLGLADVSFGPAHAPVAGGYLPQDQNGDGHPDLVPFFDTAATGLAALGDTEACLEGGGAQPFRVCGPVVVTTGSCGLGFEAGLALLPLLLWRRRLRAR